MIGIAILGYGNIGSGVVDLLLENKELIASQLGEELCVKHILDIRDFPNHPLKDLMTKDFAVILQDPEVKIVAEMMGGSHPAYDFTAALLKAGKHVVTSNKEVVANFGDELLELAKAHNVRYLFEASVGGGIPVIRPLSHSFAGDSICEITGILNGTTNYILTQMAQGGKTLQAALEEAQKLGYAEANPAADVQGTDACRKICILAALAFGSLVDSNDVHTVGITELTLRDIADASLLNCTVKLIAHAIKNEDATLTLSVSPSFVPRSNPLYAVDDVFNGILVRGSAVGEVMFYGKGAGKYPTASAVNSDIMEIAANTTSTAKPMTFTRVSGQSLKNVQELPTKYYLRLAGEEMPELDAQFLSAQDGEVAMVCAPIAYRQLIAACEAQQREVRSILPLL